VSTTPATTLPVTGSHTPWLAAAGVVLVLAGAVLYVIARRRRAVFTE
jgi:LPXTG-motif cell wall-anchored protein